LNADQGKVVTEAELHAIRSVITDTITPSWIGSVPRDFGSASHGKLKADQWRSLGLIYLPIGLIRLWANPSSDDARAARCQALLVLSLQLVCAIIVATSESTSRAHAGRYLELTTAYLEGVKSLFPGYHIHPNHHMAMHLHEYLILYGPVHAWWTFPFERLIGMLQRSPTNGRIGERSRVVYLILLMSTCR
jgi:hypothetical protein